ncbi:MAG TPA: hypothetical protein DDW65_13245 [Firmicutes bacterium]|nr:hypothetical protein [Bacillota bacterium]
MPGQLFWGLGEKILRQLGYNTRVLVFDSFIKEFPEFYRQQEVRYELAWKALKDYLVQNGIVDKYSPKGVLKKLTLKD